MTVTIKQDEHRIAEVEHISEVFARPNIISREYPYQPCYWAFEIRVMGCVYYYTYLSEHEAINERVSVLHQLREARDV
jgi:predicted aminopeptidase